MVNNTTIISDGDSIGLERQLEITIMPDRPNIYFAITEVKTKEFLNIIVNREDVIKALHITIKEYRKAVKEDREAMMKLGEAD